MRFGILVHAATKEKSRSNLKARNSFTRRDGLGSRRSLILLKFRVYELRFERFN
jgi:hypothetical protein